MRVFGNGNGSAAIFVVLLLMIFGGANVRAGGVGGGIAVGNFLARVCFQHLVVRFSFLEAVAAWQLAIGIAGATKRF